MSLTNRWENCGVTGDHYYSTRPQAPARPTEVEFSVAGREFRLRAMAGVFSAGRLDPGTAVLLRKGDLPAPWESGTVLDVGCGYGPIACVLATLAPRMTVYAVDVNERAVDATRANAAALGVDQRVRASHPDAVSADVEFDQIWSNPPIRVGKEELHAILDRWLPRLTPDGTAWLVAGRHLGGDSLQRWLIERGWDATRHASQQGFRVLRVRRPNKSGDETDPPTENL
jgi:16S rRNA (guanine1207-N2)-methyltransferase